MHVAVYGINHSAGIVTRNKKKKAAVLLGKPDKGT